MTIQDMAAQAKQAAIQMAALDTQVKNRALAAVADALKKRQAEIVAANSSDLERATREQVAAPLIKRLKFDQAKIAEACEGLHSMIRLPDPVGRTLSAVELDDGLELFRVSCPIGVIGVIFESRPDALVQISCLCLKSGNAVLLKGGREAAATNRVLADIIDGAGRAAGIPAGWLGLLETRDDVAEMLRLDDAIDLIIPRGSNAFVKHIMANTSIPVMGHADGICHVYVDREADLDMAERIVYYPKLVGMSPFSPTIGYRFLIAPEEDPRQITGQMLDAITTLMQRYRLAGCSFHYVDPEWGQLLETHGFLSWTHQSFAWRNHAYRTFDDYLAVFKSNQRRNIRREIQAMRHQGVRLVPLTGDAISQDLFPHMHRLYAATNAQFGPWGCKYLTEAFFLGLHARYRGRILLMVAYRDGQESVLPIGMSFLLFKGDRMYGRYWGAAEPIHALHFNACYYRPIEWAIEKGIRLFDPGIGGDHKIRRGFEAVPNKSYHRFSDSRMQEVLRLNIGRINAMEQANIETINTERPIAHPPSF